MKVTMFDDKILEFDSFSTGEKLVTREQLVEFRERLKLAGDNPASFFYDHTYKDLFKAGKALDESFMKVFEDYLVDQSDTHVRFVFYSTKAATISLGVSKPSTVERFTAMAMRF